MPSTSEHAIDVRDLGKCYRITAPVTAHNGKRRGFRMVTNPLRHLFQMLRKPREEELFWALRDVSFTVPHGEIIGLIGRNGAGKSTLLKILSRITAPTTGDATLHGRMTSLLEVGTGFHQELTGRENIFLSGMILGMRRAEVEARFDEIVEFAGIGPFLDTPVKRYSSGMYVRLGYAVAAHLHADILLIDEILAVGDYGFQQRCLGKMESLRHSGRTIIFVSHNMGMIQSLCNRVLWLEDGRIRAFGESNEICNAYKEQFRTHAKQLGWSDLREHPGRLKPEYGGLVEAWIEDGDQTRVENLPFGESITVCIRVQCPAGLARPRIGIQIENGSGIRVLHCDSLMLPDNAGMPDQLNKGVFRIVIERPTLLPGLYTLHSSLMGGDEVVDCVENTLQFGIHTGDCLGTGFALDPAKSIYFNPFRIRLESPDGTEIATT